MIKLDLTQTVVASGFRTVPQTGDRQPVNVETPISQIVAQSIARVGSFEAAEKVRDLIDKISSDQVIDVTDAEFETVFRIIQRSDTRVMLAFAEKTEQLNPSFSIIEYEKELKKTV